MPVRMDFYPRPPRGGRQQPWTVTLDDGTISIHALREEGDRAALLGAGVSVSISIHTLREEGDRSRRRPLQSQRRISIHALREEGDNFRPGTLKKYQAISIHALREEGDISQRLCFPVRLLFLSTPSARRATQRFVYNARHEMDFYPRPPRGGRRVSRTRWRLRCHFYPRPPRGGRRGVPAG